MISRIEKKNTKGKVSLDRDFILPIVRQSTTLAHIVGAFKNGFKNCIWQRRSLLN